MHAGDRNLWGKGIYFIERVVYSNVDKYVFKVRELTDLLS